MTVYESDAYGAYDGRESVEGAAPLGRAMGPLVTSMGAVASLALVAGLGMWGYDLAMRDVAGVPVIRALEGPMRVQPDDPGGRQAEHQGLAVNAVQAEGVAEAPPNQIILAPSPIDLSTATPAIPEGQAVAAPAIDVAQPAGEEAPEAPAANTTGLAVDNLIRDLVAEEEANRLQIVPASQPGVARSPRPTARPAAMAFASRAGAGVDFTAISAPLPASFVEPETIALGTRMVQFGAFDDDATARSEWDRISGQFADYLVGKAPVIQQAERAGQVFYRLRATGFEDLADARQFCSLFLAENMACIPVVYK
ncbi:SPOR domain-containing protein [Dinoroseobacter sp. S375]|uniref:SPOR domain-containing protein n=1 Tax=Dinoroseobacter sp. S375 TaxID=3415136 RepID=UPI003C7DF148